MQKNVKEARRIGSHLHLPLVISSATIHFYRWSVWVPMKAAQLAIYICNILRPSLALREIDGNIAFYLCAYLQRITRSIFNINYVCAFNTLYVRCMSRRLEWYDGFALTVLVIFRRSTLIDTLAIAPLCVHFIFQSFGEWINAHMLLRCCQKIYDGDVMKAKYNNKKFSQRKKKRNTETSRVKLIFHDCFIVSRIDTIIYLLLSKFRVWGVSLLLMAFLRSLHFSFSRTQHSHGSHFNSFIIVVVFFLVSIVAVRMTIHN